MSQIWLNKRGAELYPWLAEQWLEIFGFNPDNYSFLIWDNIMGEWKFVETRHCKGDNN